MHNIKIGDKDVKFVRSRGEVVYPNYVKDGLVLWYDFSGMENSGVKRGVAEDLSGNGNDGVLENFAFDEGSGYVDNGLEFDGVDDLAILQGKVIENNMSEYTLQVVADIPDIETGRHSIVRGGSKISGFELSIETRRNSAGGVPFVNIQVPGSNTNVASFVDLSGKKACISVVVKNMEPTLIFVNSMIETTGFATSFTPFEFNTLRLGAGFGFYKGIIHSVIIYNRLLTPEEIAHNYKIDKHRFNIQD